jgi:hypothetical protein
MKHILLRTDSSKDAFNTISHAVQFYKDIVCKSYTLRSTENQDLIKAIQDIETVPKINFLIRIQIPHNFFKNLLFIPVINQMIYYTNTPFLAFPSDEQKKN